MDRVAHEATPEQPAGVCIACRCKTVALTSTTSVDNDGVQLASIQFTPPGFLTEWLAGDIQCLAPGIICILRKPLANLNGSDGGSLHTMSPILMSTQLEPLPWPVQWPNSVTLGPIASSLDVYFAMGLPWEAWVVIVWVGLHFEGWRYNTGPSSK